MVSPKTALVLGRKAAFSSSSEQSGDTKVKSIPIFRMRRARRRKTLDKFCICLYSKVYSQGKKAFSMSNYKMNTKCVQGGYTPGNGEPRQTTTWSPQLAMLKMA